MSNKKNKIPLIFEIIIILLILFFLINYFSINENKSQIKKIKLNNSPTILDITTTKIKDKIMSSFEKTSNIKINRLNTSQNKILETTDNTLKKLKSIFGFEEIEVIIPNSITSKEIN